MFRSHPGQKAQKTKKRVCDEKFGAPPGKHLLSSSRPSVLQPPDDHVQELYQELRKKYQDVCSKLDTQQLELKRRQEDYQRREKSWRAQVNSLLAMQEEKDRHFGITDIREMYETIQSNVSNIHTRTSQILSDQEQELVRTFSARLDSVNEDLRRERNKNSSGSAEWIQKCHKLSDELEFVKDESYRIEDENKTYDEDRKTLIKQLLSLKKENDQLKKAFAQVADSRHSSEDHRRDVEDIKDELFGPTYERPSSAPGWRSESAEISKIHRKMSLIPRPQSALSSLRNHRPLSQTVQETRFESTIRRMRKQLETEVKKSKHLTTKLNAEISGRTELQAFIRRSIEDIQEKIVEETIDSCVRAKTSLTPDISRNQRKLRPSMGSRGLLHGKLQDSGKDFTEKERLAVLDRLFSQERVLSLLYSTAFPNSQPIVHSQTANLKSPKKFRVRKPSRKGAGGKTSLLARDMALLKCFPPDTSLFSANEYSLPENPS